ncbi:MAG: hypothetical protein ABT20_11425 [Rubrivivax sp. SCN 70-15]|nr:MAG: hypothetical protein ABT20_11425 [Rubrivivax sp. SCN 70-15]
MLRRLLAILLCLGLALQAVAAPNPQRAPCPMEEHMRAALAAGDAQASDLPDCCQDLATYAATGKACKAQLDCSIAAVILPSEAIHSQWPGSAALPSGLASLLSAAPVAGPWRPPGHS